MPYFNFIKIFRVILTVYYTVSLWTEIDSFSVNEIDSSVQFWFDMSVFDIFYCSVTLAMKGLCCPIGSLMRISMLLIDFGVTICSHLKKLYTRAISVMVSKTCRVVHSSEQGYAACRSTGRECWSISKHKRQTTWFKRVKIQTDCRCLALFVLWFSTARLGAYRRNQPPFPQSRGVPKTLN